MEHLRLMVGSLESTIKMIEEKLLDSLRRRSDNKGIQKVSLLELSRRQKVETIVDILRISTVAMNNFAASMDGKLNGNKSRVESILESVQSVVNELHDDWGTDQGGTKSIVLSNDKFAMTTMDEHIDKLSMRTEKLVYALQNMRSELIEIIDINVTEAGNTTPYIEEKAGMFDDFVLKNDGCLYKICDYRKILEHRPSELDLFATNLIDNLLILLN